MSKSIFVASLTGLLFFSPAQSAQQDLPQFYTAAQQAVPALSAQETAALFLRVAGDVYPAHLREEVIPCVVMTLHAVAQVGTQGSSVLYTRDDLEKALHDGHKEVRSLQDRARPFNPKQEKRARVVLRVPRH